MPEALYSSAIYSSENILWCGYWIAVKFNAPLETQTNLLKRYEEEMASKFKQTTNENRERPTPPPSS
jgi:hypothetical protein